MKSGSENKAKHQKNKAKHQKNKAIKKVVVIVAILAAVAFIAILFTNRISGLDTAMYVNGYPVAVDEYKLFLSDAKSSAYTYFYNKYNAEDGPGFWEKNFNGEVPLEKAKSEALEKVKRVKIEQELMLKNGIADDISFSNFRKLLKEENERRDGNLKENKVIYGPKEYDEPRYYNYLQSYRAEKLKEKLGEVEIKVTDKDLLDYYNENKLKSYTLPDVLKIKYIFVPDTDEKKPIDTKVADLSKEIRNGLSFEEAVKRIDKAQLKDVLVELLEFKSFSKNDSVFLVELMKMNEGQLSDVIKGTRGYYIVKCLERKAVGYTSFEEGKTQVKGEYINVKYEEIIKKLLNDAKVEIVEKVYKKIK